MPSLPASARVRIRRASRALSAETDGPQGELNITPFLDVIVNVVVFLLATSAAVLSTSQLHVGLPTYGPGHDTGLHLCVTLTAAGAIVSTRDGTLGAGCEALGVRGSIAVPSTPSGALDDDALARCAARLHASSPLDRNVILGADPLVPFSDVVAAMDALRGTDEAPRFGEVLLSAGAR